MFNYSWSPRRYKVSETPQYKYEIEYICEINKMVADLIDGMVSDDIEFAQDIISEIVLDNPEYGNYIYENMNIVLAYMNPLTKKYVKKGL